MSSEILRYEAGDLSLIVWAAPRVWEISSEVYTANVSRSSSRAEERILVAISPLDSVSFYELLFSGTPKVPVRYKQPSNWSRRRTVHIHI